MAIWSYVGLPRNGKSYNVVQEQIIPALKQGRRVVTNIPLVEAELRARGATGEIVQLDQERLSARDAKDWPRVEDELRKCTAGAVCVFDEVWRYLPQGLTAKNVAPAWLTLFAEHGHRVDAEGRMMQIVLVTQDLSQIAAFARSLVERTVVVTKLTVAGSDKRFRVDVYAGAVTGLKPPVSKRISEEYGTYDPDVFACYVSRTMQEGSSAKVDESTLSKRGSFARNFYVRWGLPVAAVALVFGVWKALGFFYRSDTGHAPKAASAISASHPVQRPLLGESRVGRQRISAVIRREDDSESMVLIDRCDGGPGRWLAWHTARCVDKVEGGIECQYKGAMYEFVGAIKECQHGQAERRSPEIRWFPPDDRRSREPVSVVGSS